MVSIAVITHHDPQQLGEERDYFSLLFVISHREVRAGAQGRNLEAETDTEAQE